MCAADMNKVWVSIGRAGQALLPKSAAGDAAKLLVFMCIRTCSICKEVQEMVLMHTRAQEVVYICELRMCCQSQEYM